MPVCYAGNNASIMQIYDCTVVPYIMVLQKQVGKIGTPFLIDFICSKVLLYFVFEYFMRFTMLIFRLLRTNDKISTQVLNSYTCEQLLCCTRNLHVLSIPACCGIHLHHGVCDKVLWFLTKSSLDGHSNLPSGVFGSYNKHLDRYHSAAGANVSQIHYDVVR